MRATTIDIRGIAKIEGHLNVEATLREKEVRGVKLEVVEGVRVPEEVLVGKTCDEAYDIMSRVCGVCNAIHKITSIRALEAAMGVEVPEDLQGLRRLLVIGGHLQSHLVHLYFFVLPDFLGYESALSTAGKHPDLIRRALRMKRAANEIVEIVGGRAVHPVIPVIGGFASLPKKGELKGLLHSIRDLKNDSLETVELFSSLDMPEFERKTTYVALTDGKGIPLLEGEIRSSTGKAFEAKDYPMHLSGEIVEYSSAKRYSLKASNESYMVGALARINLNKRYLSDTAKKVAIAHGLRFPSDSPFMNNLSQAVELVHFADEAMEIVERLIERPPKRARVDFIVSGGEGFAGSEAPRGLLLHHYKVSDQGRIEFGNIVTPTAQNLRNMEDALRKYLPDILGEASLNIDLEIEKLIRAYDPCVSCSARFINVKFA